MTIAASNGGDRLDAATPDDSVTADIVVTGTTAGLFDLDRQCVRLPGLLEGVPRSR